MPKVDAIIIGGGIISDSEFRAAAGVRCKSLIPICGKTMIEWVAQGLRAAESIGRIIAVGPEDLTRTALCSFVDRILPEGNHEVDNLLKGVKVLSDSKRIIMVSGDTPLITPEAVDDFARFAPDADVVYPAVPRECVLAEFPDRKWIFVKAREGKFTGSSTVMFRPQAFRDHENTLRRVFDSRRSVKELVKMWGVGFALKFALGRLSILDAERRISDVLGINGRAYISRYPELAFDVDKPSDILLAQEKLAGRG